jgi:hypothetical protein
MMMCVLPQLLFLLLFLMCCVMMMLRTFDEGVLRRFLEGKGAIPTPFRIPSIDVYVSHNNIIYNNIIL